MYFQNGFQYGRQYFKTTITHLLHGILLESLVCPDMWLDTAKMFISDSNSSPNIVFMQLKQIKNTYICTLDVHYHAGVEVKWL